MMLTRFRWYRRMRGGYWAQVSSPMSLLGKLDWVKCDRPQPTPDKVWEFYPWAKKEMGNSMVDEWHAVEPCWAVPYSQWIAETLGTNDMACVLGLIRSARKAHEVIDDVLKHSRPIVAHCDQKAALDDLRLALIPFRNARTVPDFSHIPNPPHDP